MSFVNSRKQVWHSYVRRSRSILVLKISQPLLLVYKENFCDLKLKYPSIFLCQMAAIVYISVLKKT